MNTSSLLITNTIQQHGISFYFDQTLPFFFFNHTYINYHYSTKFVIYTYKKKQKQRKE